MTVAVTPLLLDEITRRLVEELRPERIYLFGSHAWGAPDKDSDVDLLVVLHAQEGGALSRRDAAIRARRSLRGMGIAKDILIRTSQEMEERGRAVASIERLVLDRGRLLWPGTESSSPALAAIDPIG